MGNVFSTSDDPRCRTTAVSNYANVTRISRREVLGTVRGFTVDSTDPLSPVRLDLLLVFTGRSTWNDVESQTSESASSNEPFAEVQRSLFGHCF